MRQESGHVAGAAFIICFFGLMVAVTCHQLYYHRKSTQALYEFSLLNPGALVPVDCRDALGVRGSDFMVATVRTNSRSSGKAGLIDVCWFPVNRYASLYDVTGDIGTIVAQRFNALRLHPFELRPTKVSAWPLFGIPIGIFIFFVGLSLPFVRGSQGDEDPSIDTTETRVVVDPVALHADLARLRNGLKNDAS